MIIDDVARPFGLEAIEQYAKRLLDTLESIYSKGAESMFIPATTRDGFSRSLLARHNYVALTQVWNLSREAHEQLLEELGAPRDKREEAWLVTGVTALHADARIFRLAYIHDGIVSREESQSLDRRCYRVS